MANSVTTGFEYRVDGGFPVDNGFDFAELVASLDPGRTYGFQIRAYDADGNRSDWCDEVEAATPGPALVLDGSGNAILDGSGNAILAFA